MDWTVTVDRNRCTGCGECVEGCPGEVFDLTDGCAAPVRPEECHGCRTCEQVCEEEAVHVREAD